MSRRTLILATALFAVALAGVAGAVGSYIPPATKCGWAAFPAVCNDGVGCAGPGSNIIIASLQPCTDVGSWTMAGTGKATCTGHTGGCFPLLRFWEYNRYMNANSGCQKQDSAGLEWMQNGDELTCGAGFTDNWYAVNTSWQGTHIDGAPSAPSAMTVFEISFFEAGAGYFSVAAFHDGGGGLIDPSSTASGQPIPMLAIPAATGAANGVIAAPVATFDLTLPAAPAEAGETGKPTLIAGAAVLYYIGTAAPASIHDPVSWTGWACAPGGGTTTTPVVVPWGATTSLEIPDPGAGNTAWVGLVIAYSDTSVTAPNFLGSLAVGNPLQLNFGTGPAVEWGGYTATLTSQGVLVEWNTLSEVDTLGYFIEKSDDSIASNFRPIAGGVTDVRYPGFHYSYLDRDYQPGTHPYYRVVELTPEGENDRTEPFTFTVGEGRQLNRTRSR